MSLYQSHEELGLRQENDNLRHELEQLRRDNLILQIQIEKLRAEYEKRIEELSSGKLLPKSFGRPQVSSSEERHLDFDNIDYQITSRIKAILSENAKNTAVPACGLYVNVGNSEAYESFINAYRMAVKAQDGWQYIACENIKGEFNCFGYTQQPFVLYGYDTYFVICDNVIFAFTKSGRFDVALKKEALSVYMEPSYNGMIKLFTCFDSWKQYTYKYDAEQAKKLIEYSAAYRKSERSISISREYAISKLLKRCANIDDDDTTILSHIKTSGIRYI